MAAQALLPADLGNVLESAAVLSWADNANPEYMIAWEKGKLLHNVYKAILSGGGVATGGGSKSAKEQCLALCRAETQQNIANYVKKHPEAPATEIKLMVAKEIQAFKTTIAPLVGAKSSRASTNNRKSSSNARREARKAIAAARAAARAQTAATMSAASARSGGGDGSDSGGGGAVGPRPIRQRSTPKVLDANDRDAALPSKYFSQDGNPASGSTSTDMSTTPAAEEEEPVVATVLQTPTPIQPAAAAVVLAENADAGPDLPGQPVQKASSSFSTRPARVTSVDDVPPSPTAAGVGHGLPQRSKSGRVLPRPPGRACSGPGASPQPAGGQQRPPPPSGSPRRVPSLDGSGDPQGSVEELWHQGNPSEGQLNGVAVQKLLRFCGIPKASLKACWKKAKKPDSPTGVLDAEEFSALCRHIVVAGGNPLNTRAPLPTVLPDLSVEQGSRFAAEVDAAALEKEDEFV